MDKLEWQKRGQGHRQRLRDRFLERGVDTFTDAEVVELLLTLGTPRKDCKQEARALLDRFATLSGVLDAGIEELTQVKGVGPKNGFALRLVQEVARRYLRDRLAGREYLRSTREVKEYLVHAMRGLTRETFQVILLDAGLKILGTKVVAEGTLTSAHVHPREVVALALMHHAAALIIAHNHPSGRREPSRQDILLTKRLYLALGFAGVDLLDHLLVGEGEEPASFADLGIMEEIRNQCAPILSG